MGNSESIYQRIMIQNYDFQNYKAIIFNIVTFLTTLTNSITGKGLA